MSWLGKVFGTGVGAAANGVADAASKAADIVERWAPSTEKKAEIQLAIAKSIDDSVAAARAYDPRGATSTWFDSAVDGVNRLIRPATAVAILGHLFGWWALPAPGSIDPRYWTFGEAVIGFYFGVRTVIRDIPSGIAAVRGALR